MQKEKENHQGCVNKSHKSIIHTYEWRVWLWPEIKLSHQWLGSFAIMEILTVSQISLYEEVFPSSLLQTWKEDVIQDNWHSHTSGCFRHFSTLSRWRYQIGLFKNAKIKREKIGLDSFFKKPHLVAPKSPTSGNRQFWCYQMWLFSKIAQKRQKTGSCGFQCYQMWISQK